MTDSATDAQHVIDLALIHKALEEANSASTADERAQAFIASLSALLLMDDELAMGNALGALIGLRQLDAAARCGSDGAADRGLRPAARAGRSGPKPTFGLILMSAKENTSEQIPAALQRHFDAIVALTDACCQQHLNADYRAVCRRMTAKLCRKRPSPLLKGRPTTWACGIVYALGRVNFLFDQSQTPSMRADELCAHFGLSVSTGGAKSKAILDLLQSGQGDPHWTLSSQLDDNPLAWMIQVNGLIVDARSAPREIQQEAFQRGLIPNLPDDQSL